MGTGWQSRAVERQLLYNVEQLSSTVPEACNDVLSQVIRTGTAYTGPTFDARTDY
jgi:hypothetical protein